MNDYILLMHDDVLDAGVANDDRLWAAYFVTLRASGQFDGGSVIGSGAAFRKGVAAQAAITALSGYIRIRADSLEQAQKFLVGNPAYEAGGTVEVRELPVS